MGASCCGLPRHNVGVFSKLIEEAKKPKAAISFSAEFHASHQSLMATGLTEFHSGYISNYCVTDNILIEFRLKPQSYSDILESQVLFQEDIVLFTGRDVRRNMASPRPSDRAQGQCIPRFTDDPILAGLSLASFPATEVSDTPQQRPSLLATKTSALASSNSRNSPPYLGAATLEVDEVQSRKRIHSGETRSISESSPKRTRKSWSPKEFLRFFI
jgi:hypothetical protein